MHTDLEHLYRIYSIPTHDKHQWLLLQFTVLLMLDAKGVRNMQSILVVVNKHNTARVASCWFIIYCHISFLLNLSGKKKNLYDLNFESNIFKIYSSQYGGYTMGQMTKQSLFNSQQGYDIFLLSIACRLDLQPTQPPIQWIIEALSWQ